MLQPPFAPKQVPFRVLSASQAIGSPENHMPPGAGIKLGLSSHARTAIYGVDIMEEATEICKLRLFLKLVAQVNAGEQIEPLPDIDFNIRAGNTLVGFANESQLQRVLGTKLDFDNTICGIKERAALT